MPAIELRCTSRRMVRSSRCSSRPRSRRRLAAVLSRHALLV